MVNTRGGTRHELSHSRGTHIYNPQKTLKIHNYYPKMNVISHMIVWSIYLDERWIYRLMTRDSLWRYDFSHYFAFLIQLVYSRYTNSQL